MKKSIKEFCQQYNITEEQFHGRETVGGDLYLGNLTSIPDGFNPTVGGYLYLRNLTSIPDGFNPTVGGYLYLGNLTSIPDGFNPTVGGDLYLRNLTSIPDGFNPTVGGYLDLGNLTSIPDGFNPTVGGYLYLRNGLSANSQKPKGKIITPKNKLLFWQDGKFVKADGMFTEVVSKKGNAYLVKKVHSAKEFYLVTDGETHAHGETLHKAQEDFKFKIISEKLKKEPILKDTVITISHYRLLTGACEMGVKSWMQSTFTTKELATVSDKGIKAADLLPILKKSNAYGLSQFEKLVSF